MPPAREFVIHFSDITLSHMQLTTFRQFLQSTVTVCNDAFQTSINPLEKFTKVLSAVFSLSKGTAYDYVYRYL